MKGKFKQWIAHNKLTEDRANPLNKLKDFEGDKTRFLVLCDWLQEKGYESQPLNIKDLAYIKPISSNLTSVLKERFPHMEILRRGGGMMPKRTYYTLFNRSLLEESCGFLHISVAQHVENSPYLQDEDFILNYEPNRLTQIAQEVYKTNPELFTGQLSGRGAVQRGKLDTDIWSWDHVHALEDAKIPSERMRSGTFYNYKGLLAILQVAADEINKKWGRTVNPLYTIDQRV
jgi:hypothetical protein